MLEKHETLPALECVSKSALILYGARKPKPPLKRTVTISSTVNLMVDQTKNGTGGLVNNSKHANEIQKRQIHPGSGNAFSFEHDQD